MHGLTNIMLFVVMPYAAHSTSTSLRLAITLANWGGSGLAVVAMLVLMGQAYRSGALHPKTR